MMNYYAQGGEALGLKSLAQQLPSYGRYNDDMVAHISSDEARLLKAMGGAGTINPITGLPEYGLGKIGRAIEKPFRSSGPIGKIIKPVVEPLRDIIQDLGPIGTIAATYFGGPIGAGIVGGLSGQKGFDFKRALLSGALAYGAQNLAQGLSDAGGGSSISGSAPPVELGVPGTDVVAGEVARTGLTDAVTYNPLDPYNAANPALATPSADMGPPSSAMNFTDKVSNMADAAYDKTASGLSSLTDSNYYADKITSLPDKLTNIGSGISNLVSGDPNALAAFKASGATLTNTALPMFVGYTGVAGMDEAEKMKNEADLANAKSKEEYDSIMARIEASRLRGIEAMKANPYQFAMGGSVDDEAGIDSLNFQSGNMDNGMFGGQLPSYAKGGQPRFLSGGGDGMSDDIKATINNKQPARLADGEFVIPADVVSHLGNGSSKAGAKQLYSMMDRVRSARTGNKKQGKQIKPANFMPA